MLLLIPPKPKGCREYISYSYANLKVFRSIMATATHLQTRIYKILSKMYYKNRGQYFLPYLYRSSSRMVPSCLLIIIIIIRRFIKRRSSAKAEGKGAVHVFNVLSAIIRMFKKMCFEPRFKSFQGRRILHIIWEAVPRSGSCNRERTVLKLRGRPRYLK